jgi:predicted transcriptional regulator
MVSRTKPLLELTAADLQSAVAVLLPARMPLRDAAKELARAGVHGAPVVDETGRCIGVLSVSDLARWAVQRSGPTVTHPRSCSYQEIHRGARGEETVICSLPPGQCPFQTTKHLPDGQVLIACREPHSVCLEWQMVDVESLPVDDVQHSMTAEPLTVGPSTPICDIARLLVNSVVQRVIVVDADKRPVGVVSSTDLVAALARANDT